jgi:hypothetical protein
MLRKVMFLAVLCIMAMAVTAYGADKLIVQDGSSNTQFVVTDTGQWVLGGAAVTAASYGAEIIKTGANSSLVVNRTDGAKNFINASATAGNFGTVNNFPARILVNSSPRLTMNTDNSVTFANGASITAGGVWVGGSSRASKENISELSSTAANEALNGLNPVIYNYKVEKDKKYVGFIAEDVPDMVASRDRKGVSPMDVVAVLTKVVKEQKQTLDALEATVARLEAEVSKLKNK